MTTQTLSNTYVAGGYAVAAGVTDLTIEASAAIGGAGVIATQSLQVDNYGAISAGSDNPGIMLHGGGVVTNAAGAVISGLLAVESYGPTTLIANYGVMTAIAAAIDVSEGTAQVFNGNFRNTTALVSGDQGINIYGGVVSNYGTVMGKSDGVLVGNGGTVKNGTSFDSTALISGQQAIELFEGSTLVNFGTVAGSIAGTGVGVGSGGQVTNGTTLDRTALIQGGIGIQFDGAGTLANLGTILGLDDYGVGLPGAGTLTNGTVGDRTALIEGTQGVSAEGALTLGNFGTILGETGWGVTATAGGTLINGSALDTAALIEGYGAIGAAGSAVAVANFGAILSLSGNAGISLMAGGSVANGSLADMTAVIGGYGGVLLGGAGSVGNLGTIDGRTGDGVLLAAGGQVTNGAGSDRAALIQGYVGIVLEAGGSVANLGTIRGTGPAGHEAVYLQNGGALTNGTLNDTAALIDGYGGLVLGGAASAQNFGTILGDGATGGAGVALEGAARLANGSSAGRAGQIAGLVGVEGASGSSAVVDDFGTITGTGGTAVLFQSPTDRLVDEAGAVFDGLVLGGGGILELAAGHGSLSGLGTSFSGFGKVALDAGGSWTLTGGNSLAAGSTLSNAGTLTVDGTLLNAGTVTGGITLAGGLITDGSAAGTKALIQGTTGVVLAGPGTLVAFGTVAGTGGTAVLLTSSEAVLVVEAHAAFQGQVRGGGGTLELAAGTGTLAGLGTSLAGFGLVEVEGAWSLSGAASLAAGETLVSAGALTLGGSFANAGTILAGAKLTLGGGAVLTNAAGGVLDFAHDTGIAGGTLHNAGLVEKTGGGGTSAIAGPVVNTGTIAVASGTLDLKQAVSGSGLLRLAGAGTLELDAAVAAGQEVDLTGAGETLRLAAPAGFAAGIAGLGAGDTLDLRGFAVSAGESATYTANGGNTGGALKIVDGAKSFTVTLFGQYAAAGFILADDGHGGSAVTYVPPPAPVQLAACGH